MIIAVSIVDKHKPEGERHVGTYQFEIDYPDDTHFDLMVVSSNKEHPSAPMAAKVRPYLNRLLSSLEMQIMNAELNGESN